MAPRPLTATVDTASRRVLWKRVLAHCWTRAGEALLAGSYGIRVAQGLVLASGMHTYLQTRSPAPQSERGGGEGALPGPAPQLPAPAWGSVGEEEKGGSGG